jgi:hypothetical protein
VIYPPTGLTAATGIKAVKLSWTAANSDEHLRYEVEVRDVGRGSTSTKSSFTNNLTFYGRGGSYVAKVWSVGRNGRSSEPEVIEFDIGADVMQIEGAKVGTQERGTLIQDDILHLSGYNIFVWGAVVLDEFIAGSSNEPVTFKLWRKVGDDAVFANDSDGTVDLVETISLYPATEDATNLSDSALGGNVIRFAGARLGSFGTSQSVMFSPIPVADDEKDKRYTYFLQATGREIETDEVSLSITIWAGAEGIGNAQPGNIYSKPDYVFPHYNHWHTWNTFNTSFNGNNHWDSRWAVAQILNGYSLPANQWSIAFWWRPDAIYPQAQSDYPQTYPGTMWLFGRQSLIQYHPHDSARNQITVFFHTRIRDFNQEWFDNGWVHQMNVTVSPRLGADYINDPIQPHDNGTQFDVRSLVLDDDDGTSDLMPWSTINPQATQNDGWYFTVICFEGNFDNSNDAKPMLRVWHNMGIATDDEDQFNTVHANFHKVGMRNVQIVAEDTSSASPTMGRTAMYMSTASILSTRRFAQDDKETMIYGWGCVVSQTHNQGIFEGGGDNTTAFAAQWHQAGMWNVAIDNWDGYASSQGEGQAAINYLYNQGWGTEIDWKQDSEEETQPDGSVFQSYPMSTNLCHLWQFGAVETPFYVWQAMRDTGYHLYKGDLNFTSEIFPSTEGTESLSPLAPAYGNRSFGNTAGIWDIRSPEGTNGTTQSDVCYPGQNLTDPG